MQIQEAIDIIKNEIDDFVIGDYCVEICEQKELCKNGECRFSIAIDTLINYTETIHSEFDRLEGIEDNTAILEYELKGKNKRITVLENVNKELNNINAELKENSKCLHCGSNIASYCEQCYQELIGTNAKLQQKLDSIKNTLETDTIIEAHNKIVKIL